VLEVLRSGISATLSLLGCPSLADLDESYLRLPDGEGHGARHNAHGE
jgi:isopentenyl diphosphate isomerase/L-lactate dehydrogenase-like FMN-dependent dehydrogenase